MVVYFLLHVSRCDSPFFCLIFVSRNALPAILFLKVIELMLEQYAAVQKPRQQAYLPEASVARVPLGAGGDAASAAGGCSCAREILATPCSCWVSFSLRLSNQVIVVPCPFLAVQ